MCTLTNGAFFGCVALVLAAFALLCFASAVFASGSEEATWYRGNTHAHTTNSCGNLPPDAVAAWYHDRGYNFLCITDHNLITAPDSVKLPDNARGDFILIPGEEITAAVHATGMNISAVIPPTWKGSKADIIQSFSKATAKAGGVFIINHPNHQWALKTEDIRHVRDVRLFELYNGHPLMNNEGDKTHPSTETMWDELLTDGMLIYAVASDDAGVYGKGWVMVRTKKLTPKAICKAMQAGHFYASNGVLLKKLEMTSSKIEIEIDKNATEAELSKGSAGGRSAPKESKVEERIDFVGRGGKVLSSVYGYQASYTIGGNGESEYVRARAVVTRYVAGQLVEFCAWSQPVLTSGNSE
jgi:hypothetical protein